MEIITLTIHRDHGRLVSSRGPYFEGEVLFAMLEKQYKKTELYDHYIVGVGSDTRDLFQTPEFQQNIKEPYVKVEAKSSNLVRKYQLLDDFRRPEGSPQFTVVNPFAVETFLPEHAGVWVRYAFSKAKMQTISDYFVRGGWRERHIEVHIAHYEKLPKRTQDHFRYVMKELFPKAKLRINGKEPIVHLPELLQPKPRAWKELLKDRHVIYELIGIVILVGFYCHFILEFGPYAPTRLVVATGLGAVFLLLVGIRTIMRWKKGLNVQ